MLYDEYWIDLLCLELVHYIYIFLRVLVSNFTEEQLDRYEMYRRATFPKAAIKRIMQTITGTMFKMFIDKDKVIK